MSVHPSVEANRPVVDTGDRVFLGVDSATAPEKLQPGLVSRAYNTRFRSQRIKGRPDHRLTGLTLEEFFPWNDEYANGGVALAGSVTDTTLTITTGSINASDFANLEFLGYKYVRFETNRVMEVTAWTSTTELEVEDEAYHALDASGTFVLCRDWRSNPYAYTEINRAGETPIESSLFSDPNGYEYGLIATQESVWAFRDFERPAQITVPGGIPDGQVDIVQCFNKVLLLRGDDLPVLEWDGTSTTFTNITYVAPGVGDDAEATSPIPNSRMGIVVKDRLFVVSGRDTIYHSDIGVYTRYKEFESGFRVNQGTADSITCVYPYGDEAFLVGFTRSIYLVYNIYGDLSNMSVKRITGGKNGNSGPGIAGRNAICATGDDVWFMDTAGDIWPMSRVDETRQAVGGKPVSWPIRPQLDEVRVQLPEVCRMHSQGDTVYVAVANREATVDTMPSGREITKPNLVAVYDKVTGHWAGVDSPTFFDCVGWLYTRYGSRNQLLFVGRYGGVYQYASEYEDHGYSVTTRAYELDSGKIEKSISATVSMHTQDTSLTIKALRPGAYDEETLASVLTRSRTKYLVHGKADWDPSNDNHDFASPYREDYAIYPDDDALGIDIDNTGTGILSYQTQNFTEVFDLNRTQEYVQFQITAGAGIAEISSIQMNAVEDGGGYGTF